MMTKTVRPPLPDFIPYPDMAGEKGFITIVVVLQKIIESYRNTLFAFEWLDQDGQVRAPRTMNQGPAKEREAVEEALRQGRPLEQPVLGIGLDGDVEIGCGRAVLLTLAAQGVQNIPVHIPISQEKEFKKFMADKSSDSDSGNVLFYILLVIALLAALSLAVSNSGRTGSTGMLTEGQASTLASEILTFSNHVKTASAKLRLRGCTDAQLNFENSVVAGYANAGAPSDDSCDLFSPIGGALTWVTPTAGMNDGSAWFYTGAVVVHNDHGVYSTNTAGNADLTMMLFNLPQTLCTKINEKLGLSGIPVDDGSYSSTTKFTGSYTAAEDINGLPEAAQPSPCSSPSTSLNFCGRETGCFKEESGGERYIFFQTLVKRSS